jgi:hypothetical protein
MTIWKGCERKRSPPNVRYYRVICVERLRKGMRYLLRTAGLETRLLEILDEAYQL